MRFLPGSRRTRVQFVVAVVFVALVAAAIGAGAAVRREVDTPVDLAPVGYVGSDTCRRCHETRHETWARTFHRTMTQDATPASVLADFDDAVFEYEGVPSRFTRSGDRFFIHTLGPDGRYGRFEVVRTVGSRRIQQYVTKVGDRHLRLPLAWDIEERRWFHLNGGFLHPDGADFNAHTTLWDANCIFCHNTKARPGYDWSRQTFASRVEQLGIGCESCHGPGAEHASRNANPLRRYYLHYSDASDRSIVNPSKLAKEQQVQVCGHCHGQRMPRPLERIRQFLVEGDPYTPGEDLNAYTEPIWRESHLQGVDLALRFWADGTPRLTAYEYQSLLMTVDYQKGGLTCISCHNAHGGDPKGMIDPVMRGPQACLSCHREIGQDVPAHTKHAESSSGSSCYACHMPKIVYGILTVHPTHRIQKPDPSRAWRHQMPEACTVCHTNQTARWAAESMSRQYGLATPEGPPAESQYDVAENVRALLGGDVVQRAVACMAMAEARSYTEDPVARLWAVPLLLVTAEDSYPAVRTFAFRGIRALVARAAAVRPDIGESVRRLPAFEPQATPEARRAALEQWRAWWSALDKRAIPHPGPSVPLDDALEPIAATVADLRARQANAIVSIGE